MAGGNLELQLKIQADLKQAKKAIDDLDKSLTNLSGETRKLSRDSKTAATGISAVSRAAGTATASLGKTRAGVESISTQLARMRSHVNALTGAAFFIGSVKGVAALSDEYSNLNARIRLVSSTSEQASTTWYSVNQIANSTGQKVAATAELYTRMARSLKSSGATQSELLAVTETISKAAVVSGATAEESGAAIIQLSQGLASGTLRGEEFNSVSEQMPRLMEMIQKSLGKTRGELRKMAEEGQLTTDVVFRAIQAGAADISREYEQMPLTISRATTELANAWMNLVGGLGQTSGATKAVASVISGLAGHLDVLMTAATAVAVSVGGRYVAAMISAGLASRAQAISTSQLATAELAQSRAAVAAAEAEMLRAKAAGAMNPGRRAAAENMLTAALTRQAAAEKVLASGARVGLASRALGVFGGPLGLAITGVTLAVGGLATAYAATKEREAQLEQQHRQTIQTLEDQRSKTQQLVDVQGRLKGTASTGEALEQQSANADVLGEDAKKLADLESRASKLKKEIEFLSQRPLDNGMALSFRLDSLEKLQQQIEELKPGFSNLMNAQAQLSSGIDERLNRAMKNTAELSTQAQERLNAMFAAGPVSGKTPEFERLKLQIAESEAAVSTLTGEADRLKTKLETDLTNATFTAAEQLEQLKNKTIAAALAAGTAPADIDKLTASLDALIQLQKDVDKAQENKRRTEAAASAAKSQASANLSYVESLEKQAALAGKSQSQTREYELAEKKLTGALLARAQAALTVLAAEERKKQTDASATRNTQLEIEYLRAIGNVSGAGLMEVREQAAQLREEFTRTGNTEGLALIDKLLPVQEAAVRIDTLKAGIDELTTWRTQRENSIQTQVDVGMISELEGRRQLLALHSEIADKMAGYLPQLQEMAEMPGEAGNNARAMLVELENEMLRLNTVTNDLTTAFKDGLESGIQSSLTGLADGTMDLADAVLNLAKSIVDSMARIAAQQLASMAMDGLGGLAGSAGIFGSLFAATGGYITGPGTSTSDSIPARLSDGEFVMNAAAVRRYGVDFMHSLNRGNTPGFTTGGLVSPPALARTAVNQAPPETPSTPSQSVGGVNSPVIQQTLVLDASDVVSTGLATTAGKRAVMTLIRANKTTLKQELGIK